MEVVIFEELSCILSSWNLTKRDIPLACMNCLIKDLLSFSLLSPLSKDIRWTMKVMTEPIVSWFRYLVKFMTSYKSLWVKMILVI
jgi:hypothetical protein